MGEARLEYSKITHQAEPGVSIAAPSLERLYINTALALTDTLVSLDTIEDTERMTIVVSGKDRETLMSNWLNAILAHFSKSQFLCRRIIFEQFDGKSIKATLRGQKYNPIRHGHVDPIKGVSDPEMSEQFDPTVEFCVKVFLVR